MDDGKVPHTGRQIVDFRNGKTTLETALDSIHNHTHYTLFLSQDEREIFTNAIDAALTAREAQARAEEREETEELIESHVRHVELSPGIGQELQKYAIACYEDLRADIRVRRP